MHSYTWKTSDLEQQKHDYSGQKRRPLKKLHLWVSTRGFIVFVNGLIDGRDSDSKIVRAELAKGIKLHITSGLKLFLRKFHQRFSSWFQAKIP